MILLRLGFATVYHELPRRVAGFHAGQLFINFAEEMYFQNNEIYLQVETVSRLFEWKTKRIALVRQSGTANLRLHGRSHPAVCSTRD